MKIKLLCLLSMISAVSYAQIPTLTSICNPLPGDSHQQFFTDTFLQGPGGAGLTWHFDTLHNYGADTVYMSDCSANPLCSNFPGTNVYEHFSDNTTSIYYCTSPTTLTEKGYYYSVPISYSNPEDLLRYPFSYDSSFTDTFSGSFLISPYAYGRLGYVTVTADAWGVLILPNAVYPNALRVHFYQTYTDSGNSGGTPYSYYYSQNTYVWYVPGIRTEVLELSRMIGPSGLTIVSYFTSPQPDAVLPVNKSAVDISLYPNPATDQISVSGTFESGARLEICDLAGRILATQLLQGGRNVIPISYLTRGIYLCRIYSGSGNMQVKRLVVAR